MKDIDDRERQLDSDFAKLKEIDSNFWENTTKEILLKCDVDNFGILHKEVGVAGVAEEDRCEVLKQAVNEFSELKLNQGFHKALEIPLLNYFAQRFLEDRNEKYEGQGDGVVQKAVAKRILSEVMKKIDEATEEDAKGEKRSRKGKKVLRIGEKMTLTYEDAIKEDDIRRSSQGQIPGLLKNLKEKFEHGTGLAQDSGDVVDLVEKSIRSINGVQKSSGEGVDTTVQAMLKKNLKDISGT